MACFLYIITYGISTQDKIKVSMINGIGNNSAEKVFKNINEEENRIVENIIYY